MNSQDRYLAHQSRKAKVLKELMRSRHSTRVFSDEPVDAVILKEIMDRIAMCPSSCDRHGVETRVVITRDEKALLGGVLVGGVGWIHRAPAVLMLFGKIDAYQAPGEASFMPYIDAGIIVQQIYLACISLGLKCCFCNPNIREINKNHFNEVFGPGIYCGAMAIGWPEK